MKTIFRLLKNKLEQFCLKKYEQKKELKEEKGWKKK
jgi:hypothetical protein